MEAPPTRRSHFEAPASEWHTAPAPAAPSQEAEASSSSQRIPKPARSQPGPAHPLRGRVRGPRLPAATAEDVYLPDVASEESD